MSYLHSITHDYKLTQEKVNFFADYFTFAIYNAGKLKDIPLENQLSLIEKIAFQIEHNLNNSIQYIDNYLSNPLLSDSFIKEFSSFKDLAPLILTYKALNKNGKKIEWIKQNPDFINKLILVKKELDELMFKKALGIIISFFRCKHGLNKHLSDIIYYTNLIVCELILHGKSPDVLDKVFDRILSKSIDIFPFPENIKDRDLREKFLTDRNLNQQFEGIFNMLKEPRKETNFLFKIQGLKVPNDFTFKYNKVTFSSPNIEMFNNIKQKIIDKPINELFINDDNSVIASIHVSYYSDFFAKQEAINTIREELKYINLILKSNATLENYNYLVTSNFINCGYGWSKEANGIDITNKIAYLEDNPYNKLHNIDNSLKDHILSFEPLFINSYVTNRISDYWHYLEVFIPKSQNDAKRVKEIVSHILLINSNKYDKPIIENYIQQCLHSFYTDAELIGIPEDRYKYFYNMKKLYMEEFKKEVKHPFIKHLIKSTKKPNKIKLKELQMYYYSILTEAYEQRNAYLHQGQENEKSVIKLKYSLPQLILRLRWTIFSELVRKKYNNFEDLLTKLNEDGKKLLT